MMMTVIPANLGSLKWIWDGQSQIVAQSVTPQKMK